MSENNSEQTLFVSIGSIRDHERFPFMSSSGKAEEMNKPTGIKYVPVSDLQDARTKCLQFISTHNLGSANWTGGEVVDQNNRFVANISYNGRIWNNSDWRLAKEIVIC